MNNRKVIATPIKAKDLDPGELFSAVGSVHWDTALESGSVGEKCYIRTNEPVPSEDDGEQVVYRLTIVPVIPSLATPS
jgi:hypothetical protein